MKSIVFKLTLLILTLISFAVQAEVINEVMRERIRNRIEMAGYPFQMRLGTEKIHAEVMLPLFYERRGFTAAWFNEKGRLTPLAEELITAISEADQEGLNPDDYHLEKIDFSKTKLDTKPRSGNLEEMARIIDLEFLLTDGFLILGSHYLSGRVDPQSIDPEWLANRRGADLAQILQSAIEQQNVAMTLKQLLPSQHSYYKLREYLRLYKQMQNDSQWELIPGLEKLQSGDQNRRVAQLKKLLILFGDAVQSDSGFNDVFDLGLETAVKNFQKRYGLDVDGVVGKATLQALNIPLKNRIEQIELNLERWRWLPQDLGSTYVLVNIANFELDIIETGEKKILSKVIVGRDYRRTPVFSDKISYLVFNPFWHVPFSIAVKDLLPALKKNPDYLKQKGIRLFQGMGAGQIEVDPNTIDWAQYSEKRFPFQLRQDPGPNNALGVVKFMFPNSFNVYLHDTPSKDLFQKTERAYSSGCIRVQNPLDLAEFFLKNNKGWTREKIIQVIETQTEQTIKLASPIPIHLLYWTSWIDDSETINFRNDIYGRDQLLLNALKEKPPS